MVWYCNKHKQHSCDDVCWKCDQEHDIKYIDAFNAGWDARESEYSSDATPEKRKEHLAKWKEENKNLLRRRLKGSHDA